MLNRLFLLFLVGLIALGLSACHEVPTETATPIPIETTTPVPTETTAPVPTETTTPTPTPGPLSEQLGFADETVLGIQETHTDCSAVEQRETQFRARHYTAYLIGCRDTQTQDELSYLLVYESGGPGGDASYRQMLVVADFVIFFHCPTMQAENWQDVNGDGLPDLVICRLDSTMPYSPYAPAPHGHVYLMTGEGGMEDYLDACPFSEPGMPSPAFRDVDGNGTVELVAMDRRWDYDTTDHNLYMPAVSHVFALQDYQYHDVSASYPEFYEHTINVFFRNYEYLKTVTAITRNGVFAAFEGLLACDAVGRRDECWPAFWDMTDLEQCPLDTMRPGPSVVAPTPTASDLEFIAWVDEKRAILRQQYEAGLPFSPEAP